MLVVEGEGEELYLVWKASEGDTPGDSVPWAHTETHSGWLLCRQLICLYLVFQSGEQIHTQVKIQIRVGYFHLASFFCPRTGTGWQFLQLSPDCKEVTASLNWGSSNGPAAPFSKREGGTHALSKFFLHWDFLLWPKEGLQEKRKALLALKQLPSAAPGHTMKILILFFVSQLMQTLILSSPWHCTCWSYQQNSECCFVLWRGRQAGWVCCHHRGNGTRRMQTVDVGVQKKQPCGSSIAWISVKQDFAQGKRKVLYIFYLKTQLS